MLYILCGLPFSGKTTLAKKIADFTNSELVSFDTLWRQFKSKFDPKMDKNEEWKFIVKKAHDKIKCLISKNRSVVYDDTNLRYEHRDALRNIAKEYRANSIVIYLSIPFSIIKERERKNKEIRQRHEVTTENFETALSHFQKPLPEENAVEFNPESDVALWLKKLRK